MKNMQKTAINVEIISDIVCPWCFIGKRRLEKAMQLASDRFEFEVEYYPFELNPHIPAEGLDYKAYLTGKFGSEERFFHLTEHVTRAAAREELPFNLHAQTKSPNTRNIHRIIMTARGDSRQHELVERFFRAFFCEGVDLTRRENLIDIAEKGGLDRESIEQLLQSHAGLLEIEMAEKELQNLGINSVPLFIIDNRLAISGAQSVESFTRVFEEAARMKLQDVAIDHISASPRDQHV